MKLPILAYHHVLPRDRITAISNKKYLLEDVVFEQQMNYLSCNGYSSTLFSDVKEYLFSSRNLSSRSIVITFDDGAADNFNIAYPVLKKYNLRATFFIVTDSVGKKNNLTWDQIREMSSGGMEIQSHTHTHHNLYELGETEVKRELQVSKSILEEQINRAVDVVALPYGSGDNNLVRTIALELGYTFACNSTWGANNLKKDTFYLNRFTIDIDCSLQQYKSFIEIQKTPLILYKCKKLPIALAKKILGKATYNKFKKILFDL